MSNPQQVCPSCVHRAKLALLFATYPKGILGSRADLFVNDLRGGSCGPEEELATAKSHVPYSALIVNEAFLMIVSEEIIDGRR